MKTDKRARQREAEYREAVEHADHFRVSLFLGPGRGYENHPLKTLQNARDAAVLLPQVYQSNRRAVVYAISADGTATPIPDSFKL
jgi:hypothetical protein